MAGLIPVGYINDPSKDPLASTGPHLDTRIIPRFGPRAGKRINPEEARTLLQNVLVGPNKTPLVQQTSQGWKWNFPITSKYGSRTAPTARARSFHEGIDIGIPTGTQLAYKGYGTFEPDNGYGVLKTTDPQGNRYDIQFLHTVPGKAAQVGSSQIPDAPVLPGSQFTPGTNPDLQRENDILKAYILGARGKQDEEKPKKSLQDKIKEQLIGGLLFQALNPKSFLSSYIGNDPYMSGHIAGSEDYFNSIFG